MDNTSNLIGEMLKQNDEAFQSLTIDELVRTKKAHKDIKTEVLGLMVNLLSTQTDVKGRLVNPMPHKDFDFTVKLANWYLNKFIDDYFDVDSNEEMELHEENVDSESKN